MWDQKGNGNNINSMKKLQLHAYYMAIVECHIMGSVDGCNYPVLNLDASLFSKEVMEELGIISELVNDGTNFFSIQGALEEDFK